MKTIESIEQFQAVQAAETAVFLFSADWCPDCVFVKPFLPEVEEKFSQFTFYYIDRDRFIELCQEQNVFGIPSFVVYSGGREIGRFVNKDRKTQEQIEDFLAGLSL